MISKYLYAVCEANNVEKPGAVIPHAGICKGQSGNWLSYLDGVAWLKVFLVTQGMTRRRPE